MNRIAAQIVFTTLVLIAVSTDSPACGESLFRIGKGVHFRAYSAPIPGTILVYARTDDELEVAKLLKQAGHEVDVVENKDDLAVELTQHDFNVIVAPASERIAVESGTSNLAAPPDWLPVFAPDAQDSLSVRADYGKGVSSDDDIRKYLKAIHKSLKSRDS